MRTIGLCDEEESRRVLVEPVDDARTVLARFGGQRTASALQRIRESTGPVTRRWMHDHARRLVDDHDVVVLVHDAQRDLLGQHLAAGWRRNLDVDPLADARPIPGPLAPSLDHHQAVGDQRGCLRPRTIAFRGDQNVETPLLTLAGGECVLLQAWLCSVTIGPLVAGAAACAAAASAAARSSPQRTHARRNAPVLTAMSAMLNVGHRYSLAPNRTPT